MNNLIKLVVNKNTFENMFPTTWKKVLLCTKDLFKGAQSPITEGSLYKDGIYKNTITFRIDDKEQRTSWMSLFMLWYIREYYRSIYTLDINETEKTYTIHKENNWVIDINSPNLDIYYKPETNYSDWLSFNTKESATAFRDSFADEIKEAIKLFK